MAALGRDLLARPQQHPGKVQPRSPRATRSRLARPLLQPPSLGADSRRRPLASSGPSGVSWAATSTPGFAVRTKRIWGSRAPAVACPGSTLQDEPRPARSLGAQSPPRRAWAPRSPLTSSRAAPAATIGFHRPPVIRGAGDNVPCPSWPARRCHPPRLAAARHGARAGGCWFPAATPRSRHTWTGAHAPRGGGRGLCVSPGGRGGRGQGLQCLQGRSSRSRSRCPDDRQIPPAWGRAFASVCFG